MQDAGLWRQPASLDAKTNKGELDMSPYWKRQIASQAVHREAKRNADLTLATRLLEAHGYTKLAEAVKQARDN